jgi:hypothetical protein
MIAPPGRARRSRSGFSRDHRACPGGALIGKLHYAQTRSFRDHRACPGGALTGRLQCRPRLSLSFQSCANADARASLYGCELPVGNHLHVLVGCDVVDAPRDVALSMMNNLAFAHGMTPVYRQSFYVGTFGPYDHGAIRRRLTGGARQPGP